MQTKNVKIGIIIAAIMLSILFASVSTISAAPTVTVSPLKPKPASTVTFTLTISGASDISTVAINVQECTASLCFADDFNQTMTEQSEDTYTTSLTLKHSDATEMKYRVGYRTPTGWTWDPADANDMVTVSLDTSSSDSSNSTPGFEIIFGVLAVLLVAVVLYKRGR